MRLLVLCLVLVLCAAGCTATPPAVPTPTPSVPAANLSTGHTTAQMVAFVHDAAAFARANGRDAALSAFMNRTGPFFRDDLYIYAYDFDGITLAHPLQTRLVGKSRLEERDAGDTLFIRNLRDVARNGTGFVRFWYVNPAHENATEAKLGYVERVDDDWWLGSGVYMPVDPDPTAQTVALVEEAVRYAKANGKAAAIAAFADPNGSFVRGERSVFAYDLDGTVLALPGAPVVGTNQWDAVDPNGVRMVRQMARAALEGGGFVTYATTHRLDSPGPWEKHVYVAMAGDGWFVGSGTYVD